MSSITNMFRWLLLVVPLVAGAVTFVLLRALVRSGAARLTEMPAGAIRQGWRRDA